MALLANPRAYDGKLIQVEGYFDGTHFESCRLFLSKGDFEYDVARNSIYVRWPGCLNRHSAGTMQRRYAEVEGIFIADIGSVFESFSEIREVQSINPLESRAEFFKRISAPWWLSYWPWPLLGILFVATSTSAAYLIARRVYRS